MAAVEVKLFGKWSFDDVEVNDISLEDYLAVKTKYARFTAHTAGRYQKRRFRKAQCPIVERLTNSLMMHGRNNGKKLMATRIVSHAFDIVNLLTDQNPIQVLVDAIINGGPREDATRIGSAGVVRRQAVDVSPLRRVNQAIWLITTGAREASFRNIKTISECLADELINAAKGSSNSYAIKKKDEIERVAKANRCELLAVLFNVAAVFFKFIDLLTHLLSSLLSILQKQLEFICWKVWCLVLLAVAKSNYSYVL
jgi:small subunit ribosomal protein S5e